MAFLLALEARWNLMMCWKETRGSVIEKLIKQGNQTASFHNIQYIMYHTRSFTDRKTSRTKTKQLKHPNKNLKLVFWLAVVMKHLPRGRAQHSQRGATPFCHCETGTLSAGWSRWGVSVLVTAATHSKSFHKSPTEKKHLFHCN
jgi:hypothetical protein